MMFAIFAKAFSDYSKVDAGYAHPLFGIQVPIVIGIGGAAARAAVDAPVRP